jgi:hypothetical protein
MRSRDALHGSVSANLQRQFHDPRPRFALHIKWQQIDVTTATATTGTPSDYSLHKVQH